MLKTLLAGTALASLMALGAQAQEAPAEAETTPPAAMENQLPSATSEEPAAPIVPETADDAGAAPAPDAVAPDAMAQEPRPAPDAGRTSPRTRPSPRILPAPTPGPEEGWTTVDLATISADTLIGTDIRTYDQETVASVEDVLMTPDGQVENVVARFGGFLGFGETTVLARHGRDHRSQGRGREHLRADEPHPGSPQGAPGVHAPRGLSSARAAARQLEGPPRLAAAHFLRKRTVRGRKPLADRLPLRLSPSAATKRLS